MLRQEVNMIEFWSAGQKMENYNLGLGRGQQD